MYSSSMAVPPVILENHNARSARSYPYFTLPPPIRGSSDRNSFRPFRKPMKLLVTTDSPSSASETIPIVRRFAGLRGRSSTLKDRPRRTSDGSRLTPKPFSTIPTTERSSLSVYLVLTGPPASLSAALMSLSQPAAGNMKGSRASSSRGTLYFSGLQPTEPYIAWTPSHDAEERVRYLEEYRRILEHLDERPNIVYHPGTHYGSDHRLLPQYRCSRPED